MSVEAVLDRLHARRNGAGWSARCPAHEDKNPSLSISEKDGKILLYCHAGCTVAAICAAIGMEMRELFAENSSRPRIVTAYDYTDENGALLFQVIRFEPKDFRQRRSDGKGSWTWNTKGVRRVLYRFPDVRNAKSVLIAEGEKDCEMARQMDLVATCNAGGAGKWREEYSEPLRGKRIVIIADADEPGRKHAQQVAASLFGKAKSVKVLELAGAKDLSEWIERGGTRDALLELIRKLPEWKPSIQSEKPGVVSKSTSPWERAVGMDVFLAGEDELVEFLFERVIAKGAVTEIFSPRGLGKSLWAIHAAVLLARKGHKILLIDRDNPRRAVKERLRAFGATPALTNLKFLSRENAPPLTNSAAWVEFPYADYDVVILDSLDSAAEGVGEQDSAKPARAIAPLLDIARRDRGPAVLVLGNCVRNAAHSRGSGVIEDRADIVFEVRDATNFHPSGKKAWIEELPGGGADHWAARASRRKRREKYRLAFIATKFRIGEEPDAFVEEIDLTTEPWSVRDVTDNVDAEGREERERQVRERAEAMQSARRTLVAEILRCREAGKPPMLKDKDAVPFLVKCGLTRNSARELVNDPQGRWEFRKTEGAQRHSVGVFLPAQPGEKDSGGGNTTAQKSTKDAGLFDADFRHPHPEHAAEIDPPQRIENKEVVAAPIAAAVTTYYSPEQASVAPHSDDDEVRL